MSEQIMQQAEPIRCELNFHPASEPPLNEYPILVVDKYGCTKSVNYSLTRKHYEYGLGTYYVYGVCYWAELPANWPNKQEEK